MNVSKKRDTFATLNQLSLIMKKQFIFFAILLLFAASCHNNEPKDTTKKDPNEVDIKTYSLHDSVYIENEYNQGYSSFNLDLDLPVTENQTLRKNILNWILSSETENYIDSLNATKDNFFSEDGSEPGSRYEGSYSLSEQTDQYVTYIFEGFEYLRGAHELPWYYGATFSKIDGSIVGYDLFEDPEQLTEIITKNIKAQYFEMYDTDEEEYYFDPEEIFPLPENEPWIETDSVVFCYSELELETYSAGIPLCKIALTDLKPYLSEKGRAFIKE